MDAVSPFRILLLPHVLRQARLERLVRRILLIPSWEGHSAEPEEKRVTLRVISKPAIAGAV
jgi:hypothetical protein